MFSSIAKSSKRTRFGLSLASILVVGLSFFVYRVYADDLRQPTKTEEMVSKLVAKLMQEQHLSSRQLDNTISTRAFKMFIKNLDPMKAYFLQSDIDEFSKWESELDDQMKRGDFSTAFAVFNRFIKRVDQRTELALEMIDADHDFTLDEEMVTDPDLLQFPKNEEEVRDSWRKRIKYSLLVLKGDEDDKVSEKKTDDKSGDEKSDDKKDDADKPAVKKKKVDPKETLRKRYTSFSRRMHQIDSEDVVERYITAITSSFDPHTAYMSKGSFENFLIQMALELEGIGATLQATDDGYTVIKAIVPGGAAAKQGGIKVEDKIVAVGQGEEDGTKADAKLYARHGGDYVDATGMKLDDVVGMIRGKAGTVVRLNVMSENGGELQTVKITREKIKLEDSAAQGAIFEEGKKADGSPRKIGVIELPSFYANMGEGDVGGRRTTTDVQRILVDFKNKGVDAVVLDLRNNGGGLLREAIDCTGLFIDVGPVVQVKDPFGSIVDLNDESGGMTWDKPLVVLTSKFSASASEILAGAVQDYNRGLVVGDTTTHGKGTVQSMINLNRLLYRTQNPPNILGALKITTQQFYRPNGDSTQKRGVLSDLVLPSITDHMDVGEADLDYPVEFDRVPSASYTTYNFKNKSIMDQLQKRSQTRLADSEEFQERIRKINKYVEQKELKSVSLNEEKFLARRRELNADKENEAIAEQTLPSNEIERNFYLDEVLRITSDYMDLLSKNS